MAQVDAWARGAKVLGELTISELVFRSLRYLRAGYFVFLGLLLLGGLSALLRGGAIYLTGYLIVVVGLVPPIGFWIFSVRRNIPLVPSLALVNLVWNALPLAFANPQLARYSDDEILQATGEIMVFGAALTAIYLLISSAPSRRPTEYLGFAISKFRSRKMVLGVSLAGLVGSVLVEYLMMSGIMGVLLARLPAGTFSLVRVGLDAAKLATGFVLGYAIGAGYISGTRKIFIWTCWSALFVMALASLLLSSAAGLTIAIAAGLYLGSSRIPWKYMIVVLCVVAFFNYSKHEMRKKYWSGRIGSIQVEQMPGYFTEWSYLTIEKLFGDHITKRRDKTQGLLERVSTLQMMLFVQRAVQTNHIPVLNGETYAMIPKLMVPRILWPEKPRTHEGQVLLNTHFGRQKASETWQTYIAWGLIAESYGNFGSILGPLILAVLFGVPLASIEVWTGNYPLLSLRGSLAAALLLQVLVSYEMTAAVFVTSTGQLLAILVGASALLAGKHALPKPT